MGGFDNQGYWIGLDGSIQNTTIQDTRAKMNHSKDDITDFAERRHQFNNIYDHNHKNNLTHTSNGQIQIDTGREKPQMMLFQNQKFGDQSTIIMDETKMFLNQTHHKTLLPMTQTQGGILDDDGNHNDYYNQLNSPGKDAKNRDATYNLQLRIFYQTDFGESLQVVGSIEELGSWKNY